MFVLVADVMSRAVLPQGPGATATPMRIGRCGKPLLDCAALKWHHHDALTSISCGQVLRHKQPGQCKRNQLVTHRRFQTRTLSFLGAEAQVFWCRPAPPCVHPLGGCAARLGGAAGAQRSVSNLQGAWAVCALTEQMIGTYKRSIFRCLAFAPHRPASSSLPSLR